MTDKTLQKIYQLQPGLRAAAIEHINTLRAAGLPAVILETKRTLARQKQYVAAGKSKTLKSYHLKGRAYDIGWLGIRTQDVPDEWWNYAGQIGKAIGFRWGGDFRSFVDKPHFEY